jgi:hypothetical protein
MIFVSTAISPFSINKDESRLNINKEGLRKIASQHSTFLNKESQPAGSSILQEKLGKFRYDKYLRRMCRPEFVQKMSSAETELLDSSGNLIYKQLFNDKKNGLEEDS